MADKNTPTGMEKLLAALPRLRLARKRNQVPGEPPSEPDPEPDRTSGSYESVRLALEDDFDEELEMQLEEDRLDELYDEQIGRDPSKRLSRKIYFDELFRMQRELVRMHDWIAYKKLKVLVIFEGRDSAGKGGAIKRITARLNPRVCRVVALPAPSEREKGQWYFQRYVPHLPSPGELVLFDRSWYNRAGVERVMGFASQEEVEEFFRLRTRIRTHAGALGHHLAEILVLDHRRGAGIPLPHAHRRSAQAVEAVTHGHAVAYPLGGLHQGQGRNAAAHPCARNAMVGGPGRRQEAGPPQHDQPFVEPDPL